MEWFDIVEILLGAALLLVVACFVALFRRRRAISTHGVVFDCGMRRCTVAKSASWTIGMARYTMDEFMWYRAFSLSSTPGLTLHRRQIHIVSQRRVSQDEVLGLPLGDSIVRIADGDDYVELSMNAQSVTGMMSWLEAASPAGLENIDLAWC
ncbi:MAG: DUF2550 domain-containing protein [Propionibacteriaceae bacterium]|jgi:hypothetical protein|nr:DUF2550 domain-containing protein [Propionibacteriaceae bacterium]